MFLLKRDTEKDGRAVTPEAMDSLRAEMDRRRVIVFPGRDTSDYSNPRYAGGYIKSAERLLGGRRCYEDGVDIYCVTYTQPVRDHDLARYYQQPGYFGQDAREFADYVLMPLLNEHGTIINLESGASVDALKQRASRITLMGHSYGGVFMQEAANALADRLGRCGLDAQAVKDVLGEVAGISVAGIARQDVTTPQFRTLSCTAYNDRTAYKNLQVAAHYMQPTFDRETATEEQQRHYDRQVEKTHHHLLVSCGYGRDYFPALKIAPVPGGMRISDKLPVEKRWSEYDGFEVIGREINEQLAKENHMDVRHDLRNHLIPDEGHVRYANIIGRVFRNAVARDDLAQGMDGLLFTHNGQGHLPRSSDFRPYATPSEEELDGAIKGGLRQRSNAAQQARGGRG
jgi:pimeloyl-ACP methyl ester carboxylesterase